MTFYATSRGAEYIRGGDICFHVSEMERKHVQSVIQTGFFDPSIRKVTAILAKKYIHIDKTER